MSTCLTGVANVEKTDAVGVPWMELLGTSQNWGTEMVHPGKQSFRDPSQETQEKEKA